jgi:pimeloyl-ACP methyl ester carboxylesterase
MKAAARRRTHIHTLLAPLAAFWPAIALAQPLSAQADAPANTAPELNELFHYEPTGLSLLHPYVRGQVPVVFVHGLWANPWSWRPMIEALEADAALKHSFQFWTYGYSTGDPIPYTAHLLRNDLDLVREKFDPKKSDAAFDRMVVIGHSMGGLLTKMIAVDSGDRMWHVVTDHPFVDLKGETEDRNLLHNGLIFVPHTEIRRVVYIATPHRGSHFDRGSIQSLGTRLIRLPDPLRAAHHRLVAHNPPEFFREYFRKSMPTSIDELHWDSPILRGLSGLSHAPGVKVHSIIAVRPGSSSAERSDGLVTYESAHIADAASEKVVSANHHCQSHAEVIAEVKRILAEHAGEP